MENGPFEDDFLEHGDIHRYVSLRSVIYLSIYLPTYLSTYLPIYLSIYLSI